MPGVKSASPARLVQHDAAQGMHLFLILPEKFDDATPHDAAVGVTVPARDIPLQQHMIPIHFKRNLRTVLQDIQLPPFPGAVEKQAQGTIFSSYPKLRGTTYTSPAVPQSQAAHLEPGDHFHQIPVPGHFPVFSSHKPAPSIHSFMQRAARPASREPFRTEAARSPQISVPDCINSQAWPVSHSSIRETSASTWNWRARACLPMQKA